MTSDNVRRKIEKELRLRSEQFETLLNAAPIGVYLVDSDFRILQVNPIAEPVFGGAAGDAIGRDYAEVLQEMWGAERAAQILRVFRRALDTGEPYHVAEFAEQRADRRLTEYYDWRIERIVLPDDSYGVVCYFRDISEQVAARKAIHESETRYRMLFDSIDVGFCILQVVFDDAQRPVDYRYLEVNPAFEKQTGIKDAVGKSVLELVPGIERFWFDIYGDVALTGVRKRFEDHARSMGRWFDLDAFRVGEPEQRRVAVLFSDVTERKQAELALRESEQRFRVMADNAPALIWMTDTSGDCTYFNRSWLEFTGRALADELGEGWLDRVHPDDVDETLQTYRAAFAARERVHMEYRLLRHDGVYRWLVDEGVPRQLSDGTFAGYVGTCSDITERRTWEESLREADRRKDEFLATLSHELRNPLAAISTATTVLSHASGDAGRVIEMADIINRQSAQLVRLIDDLLDVSRVSRGKLRLERRPVAIDRIVMQAIEDLRPFYEVKNLGLTHSLPGTPVIVDADAVRIGQVVTNLLDNACKFTTTGEVKVVVEQVGDNAVVRVADSGVGMPPGQISGIFEMFTQIQHEASLRSGGLGIGLSLAKTIVELHEGTIEAQSEGFGKGSEFVLTLPVHDSAAPDGRARPDVPPAQRVVRRRILAADDNRDSLHAVALILRMKGHEVNTADDGVEALRKVRMLKPEIVLLDIGMPGMDGYEVARCIRRERWGKDMLLMAITGWGQASDKQEAKDAGFDIHLTKPVDTELLERLFESASQQHAGKPSTVHH